MKIVSTEKPVSKIVMLNISEVDQGRGVRLKMSFRIVYPGVDLPSRWLRAPLLFLPCAAATPFVCHAHGRLRHWACLCKCSVCVPPLSESSRKAVHCPGATVYSASSLIAVLLPGARIIVRLALTIDTRYPAKIAYSGWHLSVFRKVVFISFPDYLLLIQIT